MRILITGGFGNVGMATVDEAVSRGHSVEVFDQRTKRTEAAARRYGGRLAAVHYGDIRKADDLARIMPGFEAVIHLAALIPPATENSPDLCQAINVTGTANVISAIRACPRAPALAYVSSVSIMGPTQHLERLITVDDPINPTDYYSLSKAEGERLTRASLTDFCIVRLAAVIPVAVNLRSQIPVLKLLFDMPLGARCEVVMDLDVATALVNACEDLHSHGLTRGKTLILGGGRANGCQVKTDDLVRSLFSAVGLSMPDPSLFNPDPDGYYLDWYDTGDSERLLRFQRHSFDQISAALARHFGPVKPLIRLFAPFIKPWIERMSPRYHAARRRKAADGAPSSGTVSGPG
jgi:nucleoside-diphosphate-sugar epimerase